MAPIDQYFMTDQGPEYPWRDVWRRATLHAMRRSWFLGVNGFETAVILMDYYNSTIAIQYSTSTATMGFYAWGKILLRPPAEVLAYQCHPPAKFSISTHSFLPRMVHAKGIFLSPLACPALRRVPDSRPSWLSPLFPLDTKITEMGARSANPELSTVCTVLCPLSPFPHFQAKCP